MIRVLLMVCDIVVRGGMWNYVQTCTHRPTNVSMLGLDNYINESVSRRIW